MNRAVLLLGSNRGESKSIINKAVADLSTLSNPLYKMLISSFYESEPWGFDADRWFLNLAVIIETPLSAPELLRRVLEIEISLGRLREKSEKEQLNEILPQYLSREIDIDIILFNDQIINLEQLTIPHPRMHLRRFVLEPIAQIAPDYLHPIFKTSIKSLLESCEDTSIVTRLSFLYSK